MVRKCIIWRTTTQNNTRKEKDKVKNTLSREQRLKGALKKRFDGKTSIHQRCIMINIHAYLPKKYKSSFFKDFFFLKSLSLYSKVRWLFHSCLPKPHLVILTYEKCMISALPYTFCFLGKGIIEPVLLC